MIPNHIFRESDIRGVADTDLTSPLIERLGHGLAQLLREPGKPLRVIVLRDCRLSGLRLQTALTAGLIRGGAQVIDIGVGPTPLMYFAVHHLSASGGIMITGSHNPAPENGFKIMKGTGPFFGKQIQELRALLEQDAAIPVAGGSVERQDVETAYVSKMRSASQIGRTDVRFAVDAGNGAAGPLGLKTLHALGFDPIALYCDMDGTFPNHHPDPTVPKNLGALIETVRANKLLLGLAWDGDGDRLGVVDGTGAMIWGDRLLALFARRVLRTNPGSTVIGDVKCSQTLFDDVNRHGGKGIMWKTGHSLIKQKMKDEGAVLAGEMSGHFFFGDRYFGYDDGIYAALRILEIVSEHGQSVTELLADLPEHSSTPEIRVPCPDALKFQVVELAKQHFRGKLKLVEIDGARISFDDGSWGLVRASNTGPLLVVRCEAPTPARLNEVLSELQSVIDRILHELGAA